MFLPTIWTAVVIELLPRNTGYENRVLLRSIAEKLSLDNMVLYPFESLDRSMVEKGESRRGE
jgi:hypothetical protein